MGPFLPLMQSLRRTRSLPRLEAERAAKTFLNEGGSVTSNTTAPGRDSVSAADDRGVDIGPPGGTTWTLLDRIEAEYTEMPGLNLTLPQAQRLWAVNQATCEALFSRLISTGVLRKTSKGRFVRA